MLTRIALIVACWSIVSSVSAQEGFAFNGEQRCGPQQDAAYLPVFSANPSSDDPRPPVSFVMVFDACNTNVLSSDDELLSSADIHELAEGTYNVFKLDGNGSAIAVERVVIDRP